MRAERLTYSHTRYGLEPIDGYQVRAASPGLTEGTTTTMWPPFLGRGAQGASRRGICFATWRGRAWLVQRSNDGANRDRPRQEDAWVLPADEVDASGAISLLRSGPVIQEGTRPEEGDRRLTAVELDPAEDRRPASRPDDAPALGAVLVALFSGALPLLLVGPSEDAERVVSDALPCLPRGLLGRATFSTDHNPENAGYDTEYFAIVSVTEAPADLSAFSTVVDLAQPAEHPAADQSIALLAADLVGELLDPDRPAPVLALARSLRGGDADEVRRALRLTRGERIDGDIEVFARRDELAIALIDDRAVADALRLLVAGAIPPTPTTVRALRQALDDHPGGGDAVYEAVEGMVLAGGDPAVVDVFTGLFTPSVLGDLLVGVLEQLGRRPADVGVRRDGVARATALARRWGCVEQIAPLLERLAARPVAELADAMAQASRAGATDGSLVALVDATLRWGELREMPLKKLWSDGAGQDLVEERLRRLATEPGFEHRAGLVLGTLHDGGLGLAIAWCTQGAVDVQVLDHAYAEARRYQDTSTLRRSIGKDVRSLLAAHVVECLPVAALLWDPPASRRWTKERER